MRRKSWLFILISAGAIVSIVVSIYYYSSFLISRPAPLPTEKVDLFGIEKIYPTKEGGREWHVNMDDPFADDLFSSTFDRDITRQGDGSWRIDGPAVRLNVITPEGSEPWKNVEITGYAKVMDSISSSSSSSSSSTANNGGGEDEEDEEEDIVEDQESENDLDWRARGGRHNSENPCEGTAYIGTIDINGNVRWKKEIWHTGGYTDARATDKVTDSILGRWIGWKVVMYNINSNTAVKMKSYLDYNNNNEWTKVTDLVDNGDWYANSSDKEFYSTNCDRAKDYIITNGGPIVTFRSDNIIWNFKNLSVREIEPPPNR
jgi:hypothetical protein